MSLVLVDPASKVAQIFAYRDRAVQAILHYGFFPIDVHGQALPVQTTPEGLLINHIPIEQYLPPSEEPETLQPYLRPPHGWPNSPMLPYAPFISPELDFTLSSSRTGTFLGQLPQTETGGPYRLFLFYPPGSPGCRTTDGCFMTGHYDPRLEKGPCSDPDPREFATLTELQTYAAQHGETLMEVQSDEEVKRVCGATPVELIATYAPPLMTSLMSWLPYAGLGLTALLFLRKRRKAS